MSDEPLVSICLPAYNGAPTIAQTLDSIVSQSFDGLELVIRDDGSRDDTLAIARRYAERHPWIRVFRNEKNLGMDRNFAATARSANGRYVWFCGQDDVFRDGAFAKLREILSAHPDVDVVYFNYRFYSGDLSREVDSPKLQLTVDARFVSAHQYFKIIDHAPTFLAATVMRRSLWDRTPYEAFFDTHYVQMGVVLHNLTNAHVYVVANPDYVVCRIPEDSWKVHGGQMLFEIFSGTLEVYHTVFHGNTGAVPDYIFRAKVRHFLRGLPTYVVDFGQKGFHRTPLIDARMKRIFGSRPVLYWLYVWPLIRMPRSMGKALLKIHGSPATRWITRRTGRLLIWLASRRAA